MARDYIDGLLWYVGTCASIFCMPAIGLRKLDTKILASIYTEKARHKHNRLALVRYMALFHSLQESGLLLQNREAANSCRSGMRR